MTGLRKIGLVISLMLLEFPLQGAVPDPLAWHKLNTWQPALTGTGEIVAQVEADMPGWQVNPSMVDQPFSLFTWYSSNGSTNQFPNALGDDSDHANAVADLFYGLTNGPASGVFHVDSYEALHFVNLIQNQTAIMADVVNQSFVFTSENTMIDQSYDNFAERFGTLFVSGIGNGGSPKSPGTAYNSIAVGAWEGSSSIGPATNGRSKPDMTEKASLTSFSTPLVAAAATILRQAALEGKGGPDTDDASDYRTLKALLLNGTDKPSNWTNGPATPLDARHGAGVLNAFRSFHQLRGGKQHLLSSQSYAVAGPFPPPSAPGPGFIPTRRGWNLNSISSMVNAATGHHYFFDLTTNGTCREPFMLSATLVWPRQFNRSGINDLDLFLYDTSDGSLLHTSASPANNVEYLYVDGLSAGKYVLQVLKHGGNSKRITNNETYALAFDWNLIPDARLHILTPEKFPITVRLEGEPFEEYVLDYTLDLQNWIPWRTNSIPASGFLDLLDSQSSGSTGRYYRARLAP